MNGNDGFQGPGIFPSFQRFDGSGSFVSENDNGVPVVTILIQNSNALTDLGLDANLVIRSLQANGSDLTRFQLIGLDSEVDRIGRLGFGNNFFRVSQEANLPLNPSNQRRLIVFNGSSGEVLQNFQVGINPVEENNSVIASVNSITPADLVLQTPFEAWAASNNIPEGQRGNTDDPDGDGVTNIFEYFSGSNPVASNSSSLPTVNIVDNDQRFQYTRDTNAAFADPVIMVSEDLSSWMPFVPASPDIEETNLGNGLMNVSVRLPSNASGRGFAVLEITESP